MKAIFKYELNMRCATATCKPIVMPHDAKYLYVGEQGGRIFIWAEIDTESSKQEHWFEVFGTGHEMTTDMGVERSYIGSLMMNNGALVFHVYHRLN